MQSTRTTLIALAATAIAAACAPQDPPTVAVPDRASPPPPLEARPLQFPDFEEFTLDNGLRVIHVEHRSQPVASVNLYVQSGSATDPAELAGLAGLTADVLTQGTETRTAREISELIEGVGGSLNASASNDFVSVSTTTLADDLPLGLEILADVALRPVFPADEIDIARTRTLSALRAEMGQAGAIAQRRFAEFVYSAEHPYGSDRTPGTVEALTREDLVEFHRDAFHPGNAILVIAGAVDRAQAQRLAEAEFGGWQPAAGRAARFPQVGMPDETMIHLVHRPGSVQSNIIVGHLGIRPDNPDYFPLQVLNRILGGGTDARLFQILREEKGWTYGAYSRLTRPADIGFFSANAEVRTEVTDSAVTEIMHQLRRLRDEPVPAEEFDAAISYLAGSFPLSIQTPGQIAGQIARARLLGQPMEHVIEYRERIREVTPEDLRRVAREYVHPDRAAIVVVGDATEVLPTLEGIAPIRLYDIEGVPMERGALDAPLDVPTVDSARLAPETLRYAFIVQGNPMGEFVQQLRREGDQWISTGTMDSPVIRMETEVVFGRDFVPVRAEQTMVQGGSTITTALRVENGRLLGEANLPEEAGGHQTYDQAAPAGLLLPGMDAYALAAADLEEGASLSFPMFSASEGAVRPVTFRVGDVQSVEVPAGTFEAYRVEMEGGDMPMTLYLRRDAPHITVKQEFVGAPVSVELQSID